jgi:tetratricopeptide (TPR) repeat protein
LKEMKKPFQAAERAREASRFGEAERRYHAILKIPRLSPLDRAEAHLGAADVCRLQGKFRISIRHYVTAMALFNDVHSPRAVDATMGWALAMRATSLPHKALVLLRKALRHYRSDGDQEGVAFARWALGGTYRIAGDLKRGWKELSAARGLYEKLGDLEGTAYTACALGGLARMRCDIKSSSRFYRQANALMRKRHDAFGTAYSYCGLGNVHRMRGYHAKALGYFRKAEKLYKRIGDRVSYAYTLWSIGTSHKLLGRYLKADAAFSTAHRLFRATGDLRGQVYTYLGFAELMLLKTRPNKPQAERWVKAAGYLCRKCGFTWEALHVKALRNPAAVRRLYRRAGSGFSPVGFPLNLP